MFVIQLVTLICIMQIDWKNVVFLCLIFIFFSNMIILHDGHKQSFVRTEYKLLNYNINWRY